MVFPRIGIQIIKMRWSSDCPIFIMGIFILARQYLNIETALWLLMQRAPLHSAPQYPQHFNTLRQRQSGRHFADDIFKCIFLNENVWTAIEISLKFVSKGPINFIPALVQKMARCRSGNKPLSEPMMVSSLTHICVTRPEWVKYSGSQQQWYETANVIPAQYNK